MDKVKACGGFAYLATPYSKYSTGMRAAFEDACLLAGGLIESGVAVFSPIAHSHPISKIALIDPLSHDIWLKADWPILEAASCCVVALMDGWRESYGVGKEIEAFRAAGKPIFTLDPVTGAVEVFE